MRTVYASLLEIREGTEVVAALEYVGRWISDWYRRQRVSVDDAVEALASGDAEVHPMAGHKLSVKHYGATECQGQSLIDLAWNHPDQYDKSLGWRTSLALLRSPSGLLMSMDLAVSGLSFQVAPASIKLGSPRLIRDVTRLKSVFLGGQPYNVAPELISAVAIEALVAALTDPGRSYPIVLVSRRTRDDLPLIDAVNLADSLAGVAKVYELADKWAAFSLTEEVGKPLSCFDGAVRLYWPHFSMQADPYAHPLWMSWQLSDDGSAERAMRQISRTIFDAAAFRHVEAHEISSFRREAEREARLSVRAEAVEAVDIDKLLTDLYELEDRLKAAEAENDELTKECETLRSNAMALSSSWTQTIEPASTGGTLLPPAAPLVPNTVLDAVKLSETTAKHIKFLPSAHESAADSPFRQPERVMQALEALDDVASTWIKSLESGGPGGAIRQLFKERGFSYADDVSQTSKGKWAGEYKATYEGKEYDISPHITIGAKQADTCLSIHWAWDRDLKKVMVAHVGRHKTNTKT